MTLVSETERAATEAADSRVAGGEAGSRASLVWSLLAAMYPTGARYERRCEQRYPYPRLIHLTPVMPDGRTPAGPSVVVSGKMLSEHGLGFYHPMPLPHRRVIASVENGAGEWIGLLVDVSWCRFTRLGWYDSGGSIIDIVESPLAPAREDEAAK